MTKYNIIIVEDEAVLRDILSEIFTDEGFEVHICSDGLSAFNLIQDRRNKKLQIDIVLSDVNMPVRSGIQLAEDLKKIGFEKPIILLSGESGEEYELLKKIPGVSGVESKPFKSESLIENIKKFLN